MDVSCERCKTEYEFDEARLTDSGVAVKCASCGHIFLVRKPIRSTAAAAGPEKPREWKLRKQGQPPITFRELTTLQKWIVEGKIVRTDEISLKGDTWKPLGDIPELAPFFQVFENAQKGPAPEPAAGKVIPFSPPSAPAVAAVPQVAPVASAVASAVSAPVVQGGAAPAFTPVPPGQGLPGLSRPAAPPPQVAAVAATPAPVATADVAASHPVIAAANARKPPVVREAPPMAPAMLVSSSSSSGGFPKIIPIAIALIALGAAAFYFGRPYLLHPPPATPAPAPSEKPIAKVIVPVRPPAHPGDAQAKRAVKTALATTPPGTQAQKLVKAEEHARPAPTPSHQEVAQAVAKRPPAELKPAPVAKPVVAKAEPPKPEPAKAQKPVVTASVPVARPEPQKVPQHDFGWYLSHADRLRQAEHTKASVVLYEKAIALDASRAEPVAGLGLAELDLGNVERARASFGKALSLNPSYAVAVMGMAECFRAEGKKADAIRFYKRFLELVPSGEEAQAARATMARLQQP